MHNLEPKIEHWRRELERAGMAPEHLDELESHLREQLEMHMEDGKPEEEAFALAKAQLGKVDVLKKEYRRVHGMRAALRFSALVVMCLVWVALLFQVRALRDIGWVIVPLAFLALYGIKEGILAIWYFKRAGKSASDPHAFKVWLHARILLACGVGAILFGLAGTGSGMVKAFASLGVYGLYDPELIQAAIKEVLESLWVGLLISIPFFLFYLLLPQRKLCHGPAHEDRKADEGKFRRRFFAGLFHTFWIAVFFFVLVAMLFQSSGSIRPVFRDATWGGLPIILGLALAIDRGLVGLWQLRKFLRERTPIHRAKLRRSIRALKWCAISLIVAGLVGTLQGVFHLMRAWAEQLDPTRMAVAVGEVLLSWLLGILCAIPVLLLYLVLWRAEVSRDR